ncbi:hypothetical protein SAMN04489723_104150 [Algoriphagus aquimarinus]|uniref:Uncharacterized protein n=1 Tax=Algoriphagus aquimarinus TaxID=237018 RepID=A0A1I0Y7E0_9BACT|nr:hypothetical protein SAMN04489723_104150 [Algoriphagus aquimarinus]
MAVDNLNSKIEKFTVEKVLKIINFNHARNLDINTPVN